VKIALAFACVALAGAAFLLGRASVDTDSARDDGRTAARSRQAFRAGYVAGANDAFGGFDGGWSLGTPYAITLERGSGGVSYRITKRSRLRR
jgi:hypothetical protein